MTEMVPTNTGSHVALSLTRPFHRENLRATLSLRMKNLIASSALISALVGCGGRSSLETPSATGPTIDAGIADAAARDPSLEVRFPNSATYPQAGWLLSVGDGAVVVVATTDHPELWGLGGQLPAKSWGLVAFRLDRAGNTEWATMLRRNARVLDLAGNGPGRALVLAQDLGSAWFSDDASDHLIALGADGTVETDTVIPPGDDDRGVQAVAVGADSSVYLAGSYARGVRLAKRDSLEVPRWAREFGYPDDSSTGSSAGDAAVLSDGDVLITGNLTGRIMFGPNFLQAMNVGDVGHPDGFLALLDPTGTPAWSIDYGVIARGTARVRATTEGGFLLGGCAAGKVTLPGSAGPFSLEGTHQPFLAQFDAAGRCLWAHSLNGLQVSDLAADPATDEVWVAGRDLHENYAAVVAENGSIRPLTRAGYEGMSLAVAPHRVWISARGRDEWFLQAFDQ
jgi:outer membrane protein assembly factor BamB